MGWSSSQSGSFVRVPTFRVRRGFSLQPSCTRVRPACTRTAGKQLHSSVPCFVMCFWTRNRALMAETRARHASWLAQRGAFSIRLQTLLPLRRARCKRYSLCLHQRADQAVKKARSSEPRERIIKDSFMDRGRASGLCRSTTTRTRPEASLRQHVWPRCSSGSTWLRCSTDDGDTPWTKFVTKHWSAPHRPGMQVYLPVRFVQATLGSMRHGGRQSAASLLLLLVVLFLQAGFPTLTKADALERASDSVVDFARSVGAERPSNGPGRLENPLLRRYVSTDGAAVLRWSLPLPADSPLWEIQRDLEQVELELNIRGGFRRGLGEALNRARHALAVLQRERLNILLDVGQQDLAVDTIHRSEERVTQLVKHLEELVQLGTGSSRPTLRLTAAELRTQASVTRAEALRELSRLAEASIRRVPFRIPRRFDGDPRLRGRALVRLYLEPSASPERSRRSPEHATTSDTPHPCVLEVVVDGWNAPLTAGNFVSRVLAHEYDGMPLVDEEKGSFLFFSDLRVAENSTFHQNDRTLPLEILLEGEPSPLYGESIDTAMVGVQRQPPVLPVAPYGTLAMAHSAEDVNDAQRAFYIFTFDKRSLAATNPTGNAFTGTVAVFGYLVSDQAPSCLEQVHRGYRIRRAELVQGRERLFVNAEGEQQVLGPTGLFPDAMRWVLLQPTSRLTY